MPTHAQIAAQLLRDAAVMMRTIGEQNAALKDQIDDNALLFEQVADLVEKDPTGSIPD